jgi:HEPN domain-containing protein
VNRIDFQKIAELRLGESKALLAAGFSDGAYYLSGYAVECALKSCIAQRTRQHEFPERDAAKYYKHDLQELLTHAQLKQSLDAAMLTYPLLKKNWNIVKNWSEEARYENGRTTQEARDLIEAIEDAQGGILPWLQQRW